MLIVLKSFAFNACQYYGNITCRAKLLKSWRLLFPNLFTKPLFINKYYSSEKNLFVTQKNVQRYLNNLMNAYQNDENQENFLQFLKLNEIKTLLHEKIKINENLKVLTDFDDKDEKMKQLVKEEESLYKQQMLEIDEKLINIIKKNLTAEDCDNVIMEISPGVGGDEAALFAQDLFNMYTKYLDYLKFDYEIEDYIKCEGNGLKKATLIISNKNAFEKLKYESGIHRVQRTPETEKSGRVHTSTAAVTITPAINVDFEFNQKDLKIDAITSSGPGGQNANKTKSAIRVTHLPTGKIVTCQVHRSAQQNLKLAIIKLKCLLYEEQLNTCTSLMNEIRKKQMGNKYRNERIRTYNFKQDRITDHRIPDGTIYNLNDVMKEGVGLEELKDKLNGNMQQKILLEIIEKTDSELK